MATPDSVAEQFPKAKYYSAGNPTTGVGSVKDLHVNSTTGELFCCTNATGGVSSWQGSLGTLVPAVVPAILEPTHPNLLAMYTMDNISGSTLVDETSNNNDGTIVGTTVFAGVIGNALSFDGVDDRVSLSQKLPLTGDFTTTLWVSVDSLPLSQEALFSQYPNPASTDPGRLILRYNDSGEIDLFFGGSSSAPIVVSTGYIFIALSREGSTFSLSVNNDVPVTLVSAAAVYDNTVLIGARWDALNQVARNFNGSIDQFRIFDRVLTQQEVTDLYNE